MCSKLVFVLFCGFLSMGLPAQEIDGVWYGIYTSTDSPNPTSEVLIFNSDGNKVTGAYLSESGSAGILSGTMRGNKVELAVSQPVTGCPEPATGTLSITLNGDTMTYSFKAESCQGVDEGKGSGMHMRGPYTPAPPSDSIAGFWEGVYTSNRSTTATLETFYFQADENDAVTGIYVTHRGASGILTGTQGNPVFTLKDQVPIPKCPNPGTFNGRLVRGNLMVRGFDGPNCQDSPDVVGQGTARKFIP